MQLGFHLHRSSHIEDSSSLHILAVQVNGKLHVPLDVQTLVNSILHPGGLQSIALLRVRVLEGLRRFLPIHVISVNSDPAMVLTKETVGLFRLRR